MTPKVGAEVADEACFRRMHAYGIHEVLIESPDHRLDLPDMTWEQIAHIWTTLLTRIRTHLKKDTHLQAFSFFHNQGRAAGASLRHPHAQLITTSLVPHAVRSRERIAREYWQRHGRCLLCNLLKIEMEQAERLVDHNLHFAAFVPFAASFPYEIWVVPRFHQADILHVTGAQQEGLSTLLLTVLRALRTCLGNPPFNLILSVPSRHEVASLFSHWFLQIRPRLSVPAGFEMASGLSINPSLPEQDARQLRQAL